MAHIRLSRRLGALIAVALVTCLVPGGLARGITAGALPPSIYPATPPDFTHADSPHDTLFSVTSGRTSRPALIVYFTFSDVPIRPGEDSSWLANQVFGPYPSIADYWSRQSQGQFSLYPVQESEGAPDDGVITKVYGTKAQWDANPVVQKRRLALEAADPFIDYSKYDTNGDGNITNDEMMIMSVETLNCDGGLTYCGGAQVGGTNPGPALDGKNVSTNLVALTAAPNNLMTKIHESSHALFQTKDWYCCIDGYDVTQATGVNLQFYVNTSSWIRMHLGWIKPPVATKDGYYSLDNFSNAGSSLILYDPARDPQNREYFMIENREFNGGGTYDEDPGQHSGLNIWRINEHTFASTDGSTTFTRIGPGFQATWNPGDPAFPVRDVPLTYSDGTTSRIKVRAIGAAGPTQRFYVDLPGPGVMPDCWGDSLASHTATFDVYANTLSYIRLPVTNTGDASDTLITGLQSTPRGWTSPTATTVQAAGATAITDLPITASATAIGTEVPVVVTTRSKASGVSSSCTALVRVHENPAGSKWGWARANNKSQTGIYTPGVDFERTSNGVPVLVQRGSVGRYVVTFQGLAAPGGNVQVDSTETDRFCKVEQWVVSGANEEVTVACYDKTGAAGDSTFTTAFVKPAGTRSWAYMWGNQPFATDYNPTSTYAQQSNGQASAVHKVATGVYAVTLPGEVGGGTSHVTSYGTAATYCRTEKPVSTSSATTLTVRCFTATGTPVDESWTLTWSASADLIGSASPAAYARIAAAGTAGQAYDSKGTTFHVTSVRLSTGHYTITIAGLGVSTYSPGLFLVSGDGGDKSRCSVDGHLPKGADEVVLVTCVNPAGSVANSNFMLQYVG